MISVQAITKRYGAVTAVDDVSFEVKKGELLALVGGSGSGKTTTIKVINRLVEPDQGRVLIDGKDVLVGPAYLLRRSIGYVFQKVGLFPYLSVNRNVAVGLELSGWDRAAIDARVAELLELVELEPSLGTRLPDTLSGGQQQRVGVARALATRPEILLLDEPFGALDPLTRDRLQRSFSRIRRELGVTAVFVTHDLAEALALADRVGVMQQGRLLQIATPSELVRSPSDAYVEQLVDAPRRQARIFESLLGDSSDG